jgi:hypothetical protein
MDPKITTVIDKIIFRTNQAVQILSRLLDSEKVNFSKMNYPQFMFWNITLPLKVKIWNYC